MSTGGKVNICAVRYMNVASRNKRSDGRADGDDGQMTRFDGGDRYSRHTNRDINLHLKNNINRSRDQKSNIYKDVMAKRQDDKINEVTEVVMVVVLRGCGKQRGGGTLASL